MKATLNIFFSMLLTLGVFAQGPYAPAVGTEGTKAIHKDSSIIVSWASNCKLIRGLQNIANITSDTTSVGSATSAIGKADGLNVVSLGDGGSAELSFDGNIYNGVGADFVVFENAFNNTFLELAFVEVSSDGINFFRFPAHSLIDTINPVGSFGAIDPTSVNNLAGKYRANYGTPFDLEELKNTAGLDVQNITHIRIIDVVGSLDDNFATRDNFGNKINDQYPTEFPSGGFDLDAIGVVYLKSVGLKEELVNKPVLYPNPATHSVTLQNSELKDHEYRLFDSKGKMVKSGQLQNEPIGLDGLIKGFYFFSVFTENGVVTTKLLIN